MNIYLLRHGRTSWNREHRLQGITDTNLDRVGVRQSWNAAQRLRKIPIARIITSPLRRARHTAKIVQTRTLCPVVIDNRLHEIDHGLWTGLILSRLDRRFPEEFAAWRVSPELLRLRSAESLRAVYSRAGSFLCELIAADKNADVLVVSHGVINALFICAALGAPLSRVWEFPQNNGSISLIRVNHRKIVAIEEEIDLAG